MKLSSIHKVDQFVNRIVNRISLTSIDSKIAFCIKELYSVGYHDVSDLRSLLVRILKAHSYRYFYA
jgi:hypothetical protein